METVRKILLSSSEQLSHKGLDKNVARDFLMEITHYEGARFFLHLDDPIHSEKAKLMNQFMNRFIEGEPAQYILGYTYFYGNRYQVSPDVLIPRPETEELVDWILQEYPDTPRTICDIGCGSGVIAITLKKYRPSWTVYASDISSKALAMTRRNAEELGVTLEYVEGDLLTPFINRGIIFDFIVSNPPYIGEQEVIDSRVRSYEPSIALFAAEEGLFYYRRMMEQAEGILSNSGELFFEIGYQQGKAIHELATLHGYQCVIRQDCYGKDRMARLKK